MRPSAALAFALVAFLSACTEGNQLGSVTAPSQQPVLPQPSSPPVVQPTDGLALALAVVSGGIAGEPITFGAGSVPSATGTMEFGDGTAITLELGASTTLKHIYSHNGTFVVTLRATSAAGVSSSLDATVVVNPRQD